MFLPGRLKASTLGDLLAGLHRAGVTGVLELTEVSGPRAGSVHRIHLRAGLVSDVQAPTLGKPLGEALAESGHLSLPAYRAFLSKISQSGPGLTGRFLAENALVPSDSLRTALRQQVLDKLGILFGLKDASVRFHVSPRAADGVSVSPLKPEEAYYGKPRARDRRRAESVRSNSHEAQRHDPVRSRALQTLGLDRFACQSEITRAFRRYAAQYHPDKNPRAGGAERRELMRRFAEVSRAYHELVG